MGGLCGKGKKGEADDTTRKRNPAEEVLEENGNKRSASLPSIRRGYGGGGYFLSTDSGFPPVVGIRVGTTAPIIFNGNYEPLFQKEPDKKSPPPPTPKAPPAPPANKETGVRKPFVKKTVRKTPPPPGQNVQESAPVEREPCKSTRSKVVVGLSTSRRTWQSSWEVKKVCDYNLNRTSSRLTVLAVPSRSYFAPTVLCPPAELCPPTVLCPPAELCPPDELCPPAELCPSPPDECYDFC